MYLRCAVRAAEIGSDRLVRQLTYREHMGYETAAPCNRILVVGSVRVKALDADAVDEDVRQKSIATLNAVIGDGICLGSTALRENDHLLESVIHVTLHDRLTLACLYRQFRQLGTLVDVLRIVQRSRIETGYLHAVQQQVLQRSVIVFLDHKADGVSSRSAVFGKHCDRPFAVFRLSEINDLRICSRFVADLRISASRFERVLVILYLRSKAVDEHSVDINRFECVVGRQFTMEMNDVRRFVSLCVGDMQGSRVAFPEDLYGLRRIRYFAFYRRQRAGIRELILQRRRREVCKGIAAYLNTRQTYRSYRSGLKRDLIDIRCTLLRLHFDLRHAGTVRSRDCHLLPRRFFHGDQRAGGALQQDFVVQRCRNEARQRHAVGAQVNHLEIRVLRNRHNERNGVRTCSAGLRGHRYCLDAAVQHAQHALRGLRFVEGDCRDLAYAFRQRDLILRHFRVEVLQCRTTHIDHGEVHVGGSSHREMDDVSAACPAAGANRDLIIAGETSC